MSGRRRVYTLFGQARGGPFTVYTACYGRGTHPWIYTVCAVSVAQAYALAGREIWGYAKKLEYLRARPRVTPNPNEISIPGTLVLIGL